jgi:polysaccharide export outer membrane protein
MKKRYSNYLFFLSLIFLFICGCHKITKTSILPGQTDISKTVVESLQQEYKISPQDVLAISVYQERDLNKTVRVSQDGYITYPFTGKLKVVGLTVIQLEGKLKRILGKDYFVNPQVSVFVKQYHSRKVFIMGQIKKPGAYEFVPETPLTVLGAITLAGGFTETAAINKTRVIRVEDGKEKNIKVKIGDITKKGDKSKDILLKPNDIVVVPEKFF